MRLTSPTSPATELARLFAIPLLLAAFGVPLAAHAQEPPGVVAPDARERSRAAFKRGVAQLKAQDFASARASFEQAYSLFPHPSILLNLGIARLRTGEPVLAEQDLVKFLSEDSGSPPEELAAARDALAEARGQIGTMRVTATPANARVAIDGKAIELVRREAAGDVVAEARVKAGKHAVAVEAEGFTTQAREVAVVGRRDVEVRITLARVSGPPEDVRAGADTGPTTRTILGLSLAGASGIALVTGIVAGLRAKSLADDYKDPASSRFQESGTRSTGIGFRTAADASFGIALVTGAAAIVLLFTDVASGTIASRGQESRAPVLRW